MHRQEEGGNRGQGPGREGSPAREEGPVRGEGPVREEGPVRVEGPLREGAVRGEGPVREGPFTESAPVRGRGPFQERGGARGGRPGRDAPSGRGEPSGRDDGDGRDGHTARAAELLRRAVAYALGAAQTVTPALLARPTPCAQWDLGRLLAHTDDSLAALHEGFADGAVALCPPPREATRGAAICGATAYDPAAAFRLRAARALGVLSGVRAGSGKPRPRQSVVVADAPLTATALALAGAVELAVHGWDISRAAGRPDHVLPLPLAARLLPVAHRLVPHEGVRHPLFGPPVALDPSAPPDHRLLAFLGRDPRPPDTAARRR
ncbi:maleylpyruvate isomerase N-terminal domain-containing protein [Streptomyces albus]|uniref:maleylpyruvate isomerase N-terminal domain-containing protein n=1 Tax=Streptomyces albus TaxID=1888 RepID=UPI003F1AF1D0